MLQVWCKTKHELSSIQIFEMTQKKRERCLQEVTLFQKLDHPYIIQMYDAFIDENMLIIIFEWAPAGKSSIS